MSVSPASATVFAGDNPGSAPAVRVTDTMQEAASREKRERTLLTVTLAGKREVLVIEAEIGLRIDLLHPELSLAVARADEIQPRFRIHTVVIPVDEVALVDLHDRALESRRLRGTETYLVTACADRNFAEPWVAPYARLQSHSLRHHRQSRRRIRRTLLRRDRLVQDLRITLHRPCLPGCGELFQHNFVQCGPGFASRAVDENDEAASLVREQGHHRVHAH